MRVPSSLRVLIVCAVAGVAVASSCGGSPCGTQSPGTDATAGADGRGDDPSGGGSDGDESGDPQDRDGLADRDQEGDGTGDAETPRPGEFGAPCLANSDCDSGFCIESATGYSCTRVCIEDCPAGWFCRSTVVGQDVIALCVPEGVELCKPCKFDTQCGTGICMTVGDGTYCGRDCASDACPPGYECAEVPLGGEGTGTTRQCRPKSGACDCTVLTHGTERPCVRQNEVGRCLGIEHCDRDAGWIGCTALDAQAEQCDGVDNDCNGVADDEPAKPADACFREVPVGSRVEA